MSCSTRYVFLNQTKKMPLKERRAVKIQILVNLLTYCIGLTALLSVYGEIHFVYTILFIFLLLSSLYFTYCKGFPIPRWILNVISAGVILFSAYRFNLTDLIAQMLETLLILLAIKFLEKKKTRDYMQIYAISLLLVAGSGLLSLNIAFLAYFLLLILTLTVAAVFLAYFAENPDMELSRPVLLKIVVNTLLIPLLSIPLTIIMFTILPRTNYPLFNFLNRQDKARTGFSDHVRLGAISAIQDNSATAFRVNMDRIDDRDLYWRGLVLDHFDGVAWRDSHKGLQPPPKHQGVRGKTVSQTIYLEPSDNRYLFALDKPVSVGLIGARQAGNGSFVTSSLLVGRVRYQAQSIISDRIIENNIDVSRFTQIPAIFSSRLPDLVRDLVREKSGMATVHSLVYFLGNGTYRYSLRNLPITRNPVETFLFQTKYGNCEYFASALAVMLRTSGIPARLVVGYRGGHYNYMGNYYLVSQKDAHAWVEAYIDQAWWRVDPTPSSMDAFGPMKDGGIFSRIGLIFDSINYHWYVMVINYSLDRQISFVYKLRTILKKPGFHVPTFRTRSVGYLGAAILLALMVFVILRLRFKLKSDEQKVLQSFLRRMERLGYKKRSSQGLEEFLAAIGDPTLRSLAFRFVREFERLFYADKTITKNQVRSLKAIIESIRNN
jgi:hypothetical protein